MFFIPKHGTGNIWIKDCHTEIGHSKSFARLVGDVLYLKFVHFVCFTKQGNWRSWESDRIPALDVYLDVLFSKKWTWTQFLEFIFLQIYNSRIFRSICRSLTTSSIGRKELPLLLMIKASTTDWLGGSKLTMGNSLLGTGRDRKSVV